MIFKLISPDTKNQMYFQSIILRYNILFDDFNLPINAVFDESEKKGIIACLIENNILLACCRLNFHEKEIILSQMAVQDHLQKKGNGKELVSNVISAHRDTKYTSISLSAREHVINFYRKLGFQSTGEIFYTKKSGLPHQKMILELRKIK